MTVRALLACALACLGTHAAALETAQWPPPEGVAERMKALQETLRDPDASPAQREAAREELAALLKSPAGQARGRTRDEKPARAAVAPLPPVAARPREMPKAPPPPASEVAKLEVVQPAKPPVIDPRTGGTITPMNNGFALDVRTGSVLREVPGGYVDPKTGKFVPK